MQITASTLYCQLYARDANTQPSSEQSDSLTAEVHTSTPHEQDRNYLMRVTNIVAALLLIIRQVHNLRESPDGVILRPDSPPQARKNVAPTSPRQ